MSRITAAEVLESMRQGKARINEVVVELAHGHMNDVLDEVMNFKRGPMWRPDFNAQGRRTP